MLSGFSKIFSALQIASQREPPVVNASLRQQLAFNLCAGGPAGFHCVVQLRKPRTSFVCVRWSNTLTVHGRANTMTFVRDAGAVRCIGLCLVLCSLAPRALAHGGPPSVVGVVAADATGPTVVLINEGIGLKRDARWTFLCPSLWGNASAAVAKVPLALSADGQSSWVVGEDDLYRLHDGELEAQARSDLNSSHVELLAGDSRGVFALVIADTGTEVVHFGMPQSEVIWRSTDYWTSFVLHGDQLELARMTDDAKSLVVVSLGMTGEVVSMQSIAREFSGDTSVDLRPTPRGMFAVMQDGMSRLLVAVGEASLRIVARSMTPILGPQASPDGSLWVAADDKLQHAVGDTYEPASESRTVTCLGRWGSITYACLTGELHAIDDGGIGAQLFGLQGFEGPEPQLVPAAAKQSCDFQWVLFKNDLMLGNYAPLDAVAEAGAAGSGGAAGVGGSNVLPVAGAVGVSAQPAADGGCSVDNLSGRQPAAWVWLAAAGLVLRRRRARTGITLGLAGAMTGRFNSVPKSANAASKITAKPYSRAVVNRPSP